MVGDSPVSIPSGDVAHGAHNRASAGGNLGSLVECRTVCHVPPFRCRRRTTHNAMCLYGHPDFWEDPKTPAILLILLASGEAGPWDRVEKETSHLIPELVGSSLCALPGTEPGSGIVDKEHVSSWDPAASRCGHPGWGSSDLAQLLPSWLPDSGCTPTLCGLHTGRRAVQSAETS